MLSAVKQRFNLPSFVNASPANDQLMHDRLLLVLIGTLLLFGLMMVTSASMPEATRLTGNPMHFIWRQGFFVTVAVMIMTLVMTIRIEMWSKMSVPIAIVALLMLIAVLFVGKTETALSAGSHWGSSIYRWRKSQNLPCLFFFPAIWCAVTKR